MHNKRGKKPRGPDGRFTKSQSKQRRATAIETDSEPMIPLMDIEDPKTPEPLDHTSLKTITFGRGRPWLIGDRASPNFPQTNSAKTPTPGDSMSPLTKTTAQVSDTEVDRTIEDAESAEQEVFNRYENGIVFTDIETNLNVKEEDN